ncbi:MAG: tRNA (N6-isopentenyl adenosine(37)-C2)-methylthiotransferase MiaB [Proteobacteria bacterium]|nr:tRNA (N6-isopentenyl adenosine(37)-C2)-methylthiotransferase MiaB [Desulfobacula sp.]MBU3951998.1 tRNA (N6-isopentenyl adenosine(37)-C2)-methylthiotransferase MiaB [Pseudomonadota bacterium]MBU4133367.1 tRNA (N6-isopentenyl adenosine(37)-C2)-methylthiotransferase MiaB [Pseudomonadota bacterium]
MNVYDSEKLAGILAAYGYEISHEMDSADIVVCNTCSIRHKAEEKAFSFLGKFAREKKKRPHLILVMAGCVAQQEGEKAFVRVPHLDIVLGTQAFARFGQHLDAVKSGKQKIVDIEKSDCIFEALPDEAVMDGSRISKFITIMQGCDNYCTYCVVPYVRGRERSRSHNAIVDEIKILANSGIREITLLGQNVNSYGVKEEGISFPQLLEKVSQIEGIARIRFATSHPKDLSMELIHAIRDIDKVCNHLHLPVQSGSNAILRRMNRGYTRETYISRIVDLKKACPGIALSSDIIVGFPGETPEDFNDTMELLKTIEFDSIFAFAYSDRSSAPAAKFSDQVDEQEKMSRLNRLLDFQDLLAEKKNKALIGKVLEVLVEGESQKLHDGFIKTSDQMRQMTGRSASNKVVHFPSESCATGDLVKVRIENAYPHSLWGLTLGAENQ